MPIKHGLTERRFMPNSPVELAKYPTLDFVLGAIAEWINRYRQASPENELARCGPDDVREIAKDLNILPGELQAMAAKAPGSTDLLDKMLLALHINTDVFTKAQPAVMRDLQRLCISCNQKFRCRQELNDDTASRNFREFCPNAFTLNALLGSDRKRARYQ